MNCSVERGEVLVFAPDDATYGARGRAGDEATQLLARQVVPYGDLTDRARERATGNRALQVVEPVCGDDPVLRSRADPCLRSAYSPSSKVAVTSPSPRISRSSSAETNGIRLSHPSFYEAW